MTLTSTTDSGNSMFVPAPRTCPFSAPPPYTEFREKGGLHRVTIWDGTQHWLATRHDDIRAVLSNSALSADVRTPGFPLVHPNQKDHEGGLFLRLDDPEHARIRRMLTREFSVKNTRMLRDYLLRATDELIDAMVTATGPVDFVTAFALPMPSQAICVILGVPYEDRDVFQRAADAGTDLDVSDVERARLHAEAGNYYRQLVQDKLREPGDDMISRIIADHTGDGDLSIDDVTRLVGTLVGAGHETTANMLALGTVALLVNPEQRDQLQGNPDLAAGAAEELLRYWSIVSTDPRRIATEDTDVNGQTVRAGEGVIVSLIAGNRDDLVFGDDADSVDIGRNARRHLAFGFGTHQCLGQNLARVELQVAWQRLFERIPDLRLAIEPEDIDFKRNSVVYGVKSLPVTWGPRR